MINASKCHRLKRLQQRENDREIRLPQMSDSPGSDQGQQDVVVLLTLVPVHGGHLSPKHPSSTGFVTSQCKLVVITVHTSLSITPLYPSHLDQFITHLYQSSHLSIKSSLQRLICDQTFAQLSTEHLGDINKPFKTWSETFLDIWTKSLTAKEHACSRVLVEESIQIKQTQCVAFQGLNF